MEDQFDATLYLSAREPLTMSKLSPTLCSDPAYVKMRLARLALSPPQAIEGFTEGLRHAWALSGPPRF